MSTPDLRLAVSDLLTRAGARIRGRNRADCPRCKRQRAVSFNEAKGAYHCHGAGCDFSGGPRKLARELGIARRLSPAEYRDAREDWERADRAARTLYGRVQARRFELLEGVRSLGRLELAAHEAGADHPATWDALALVYRDSPVLLAELEILENGGAAHLIRFVSAARVRESSFCSVLVETRQTLP